MYDLILKNALVLDGGGGPGVHADVAVSGGYIAAVEPALSGAKRTLDLDGLTLTPGFVDCHSHADYTLLLGTSGWNALEQGITAEVCGNCGGGGELPEPDFYEKESQQLGDERTAAALRAGETPERFMDFVDRLKKGTSVAFLLPQGGVRLHVMGWSAASPTGEQLDEMRGLVRRAMECGHLGISTGLIYPPSVYAGTEELTALARVAGAYGGVYASHIRGEGDFCIPAVREALAIGAQSGCRVQISHHKVEGKRNEGDSETTLRLMEEAAARGLAVRCDQYPFAGCSTGLIDALPPEYMSAGRAAFLARLQQPAFRAELRGRLLADDGSFDNMLPLTGFDKWMVAQTLRGTARPGETIADVARRRGCDPFEAVFDLLAENDGSVSMIYFTLNESDLRRIMAHPLTSCGTDSAHLLERPAPDAPPACHPRYVSTFPRRLRLVREGGLCSPGAEVRRLCALPAEHLRLPEIGYVRPGFRADLCALDWAHVGETGDFLHPFRPNTGIEYVFVSGETAVEHGRATGVRFGRLLRRA